LTGWEDSEKSKPMVLNRLNKLLSLELD